jgi:hypothetical protein
MAATAMMAGAVALAASRRLPRATAAARRPSRASPAIISARVRGRWA